MAVTKAYIEAICPAFSKASDAQATALISIATSQIFAEKWGERADYAIALLVLHSWTIGKNGGAGAVTSEQIGDLRVSYATPGGKDGGESSSWMTEYKRLARLIGLGVMVT